MSGVIDRPQRSECADYYWLYIDQVPDGDVLELLRTQLWESTGMFGSISPDKQRFRYAERKWSVKEVVGHVIDVERAFGFRAFSFARCEPADLPSFEQDPYVTHSRYDVRDMGGIANEYKVVKQANITFFASLNAVELQRVGRASGCDFTVRSIPYILAGHEIHHWRVLRDKYQTLGGE